MGEEVAVKRLDGYGLQGLPNFLREVQVRWRAGNVTHPCFLARVPSTLWPLLKLTCESTVGMLDSHDVIGVGSVK